MITYTTNVKKPYYQSKDRLVRNDSLKMMIIKAP